MLDFKHLPSVREDVEDGRDYEMHSLQFTTQRSIIGADESRTGGENELKPLQSSPQKAIVPDAESKDVIMRDQDPAEEHSQSQRSNDTSDLQITRVRTRSATKRQEATFQTENRRSKITKPKQIALKTPLRTPSSVSRAVRAS